MFTEKIYTKWMKENQTRKYEDMDYFLSRIEGRILDIGIGPGWLENSTGLQVVGIDIDKNSKANVVACGDSLPFREACFDSVICLDTIHLLSGKDVSRVLKKGGVFLVSHFVNKGNEEEVEKRLLSMFPEFKLLKRKIVGGREKDLTLLLRKKV